MSVPTPPPLPPPTVPQDPQPAPHPPTPPPTLAARRQLFEQPSAPFPSSPSSFIAVRPAPESPASTSASDESDRPSASPKPKPTRAAPAPRPTRCFPAHSVAEAARSNWFDTRLLLLFRLAVSALLVSHLVFFSLHKDFSYRLYVTWSYAGLTAAFLAVLMCSLVDVLRSGDEEEEDDVDPRDEEEGEVRAVEEDSSVELVDTGASRVLAQVAVPLYQVFVTAMLFSAVVYWAAIHRSQPSSIDYPLLSAHVVAPAAALLDMLLSMSIRFRLVYVLLFVLFNGAYAAAFWAFNKLDDLYVYAFLDPSLQSRGEFLAKIGGLAAGTVVAGLLLWLLSIVRNLSCVRRRDEKTDKAKQSEGEEESDREAETTPSERTHASSEVIEEEGGENCDTYGEKKVDGSLRVDEEFGAIVVDTEVEIRRSGSQERLDRASAPIINRDSSMSTIGSPRRWQRMSASGRLARSQSGNSTGQGEFDRRGSTWDLELDSLQAKHEDEYFKMPGVYTIDGEAEVVKLAAITRSDSGRGPLSRSSSGRRLSRSGSVHRLSRSGSGQRFSLGSSAGGSVHRSTSASQISRGRSSHGGRFQRSGSGSAPSRGKGGVASGRWSLQEG